MRTEFSTLCRCAVCGVRPFELSEWFTADISCDRIVLRHAGESSGSSPAQLYFCGEAHAGQFLGAWLFCESQAGETQPDPLTALPRSDNFRLTTADPAIELSLSLAIEVFWEESVHDVAMGA